ncbi:MAG: hypothetical protein H6Q31_1085 [Bacteroidetes bacterium]|jgi:hypothetical protein|nr:hypothetical protein [Bacteroidota bacterium]
MKSKCLAVVIALLVLGMAVQTADAQTRKSGVNSAAFLKVGVGARQVALGSAATSFTGDVSNMFWNPAGIALQNEMMQASFTHNNWIAGLQQEVAAVSYNLEDIGTFGVGFMTFGISDIPADRDYGYTDPQLHALEIDAVGASVYDYQDLLVQATFSRYITDNLSLGVTAKYINEKIDDQSASAVAFDLGSVYSLGFMGWNIGARLNNLGSDVKFYDYAAPIPLTFSIGTSMIPITFGESSIMLAVDLVKPQDGQQYYYSGLEANLEKMFFLRLGWKFNYSYFGLLGNGIDGGTSQRAPIATSNEKGSFGGGVRVPLEGYALQFDYAYTVFTSLDAVHRFTIAVSVK